MEADRLGDIGEHHLYFCFGARGLPSQYISSHGLPVPGARKGEVVFGSVGCSLDLLFVVSHFFPDAATASSQRVNTFLLKDLKHRQGRPSLPLIEMDFVSHTYNDC